jgi:hypothetical protein
MTTYMAGWGWAIPLSLQRSLAANLLFIAQCGRESFKDRRGPQHQQEPHFHDKKESRNGTV